MQRGVLTCYFFSCIFYSFCFLLQIAPVLFDAQIFITIMSSLKIIAVSIIVTLLFLRLNSTLSDIKTETSSPPFLVCICLYTSVHFFVFPFCIFVVGMPGVYWHRVGQVLLRDFRQTEYRNFLYLSRDFSEGRVQFPTL